MRRSGLPGAPTLKVRDLLTLRRRPVGLETGRPGPSYYGMNDTRTSSARAALTNAQILSDLLERLDRSEVPVDAGQYRSVVLHLVHEIGDAGSGAELSVLLDSHPAAAELYENLNYEYAGLCRSSLDSSLAAEKLARAAIERAMRRPAGEIH